MALPSGAEIWNGWKSFYFYCIVCLDHLRSLVLLLTVKPFTVKKEILFFFLSFFCLFYSHAQDLDAYTWSDAGSVTFQYPCWSPACSQLEKLTNTEVPPWILPGGWRSYFFVDGQDGAVGSSPLDMINNSAINIATTGVGPFLVTTPAGCPTSDQTWREHYYGVYSAQYINHPTAGPVSMGFVHAENIRMVGVSQPAADCGGAGWPTYGAFVCGAWTPNNQNTNWGQQYFTDIGPIVWPSMGYFLLNGQKCSLGCGCPSSIQAEDGYVYVFYKDMSGYRVLAYPGYPHDDPTYLVGEGRNGGIKVARAPINDALNPQAYKSFYEDGAGIHWNPSLPAGFTRDNTAAFLQTPGPQSSNVMDGYDYIRFSVAKVAGTNYYLGVGNYFDEADRWVDANGSHSTLKMALRYSYDLVHWFGKRIIDATHDWTTTHFDYPIFLSSDGWSNTTIAANDFYVVGTSPSHINNVVYKMHIYIPAPPPPPPPPPPTCYDDQGNQMFCPQSQKGQVTSAVAAILDESPGAAPGVYPNPGKGVYRLTYTLKDHVVTQLSVLDMTGRRLQAGPSMLRAPGRVTETVDISGQAKGVYLLELLVNGGKKTFKVVYE